MGKYTGLEQDIFSIFGSDQWKSEGIAVFPQNYIPDNNPSEFLRLSVVPSGRSVNASSQSGLLLIDIFTKRNTSTRRVMEIADTLDAYLHLRTVNEIQFSTSSIGSSNKDLDNPTLWMTSYEIQFNYYIKE